MDKIDNYEIFCKKIKCCKNDDKALLFLYIQNWFIDILGHLKESSLDYSLEGMLNDLENDKIDKNVKDILSEIVNNSYFTIKKLKNNLNTKIIRENVTMPVYKVKKINTYGMIWLSRQNGETIKQKISSAKNKLMAVKTRMSFDTSENRLLFAFLKEMYDKINIKLENFSNDLKNKMDDEYKDTIFQILNNEEFSEIKKWDNLPPNNTLLSDQNYKKIWESWKELKTIDEYIEKNFLEIDKRICTIFFVEILLYLKKKNVYIPQQPVELSFFNSKIYFCDRNILCTDLSQNMYTLTKEKNNICLEINNKKYVLNFNDTKLSLRIDEKTIYNVVPSGNSIKKIIEQIFKILPINLNPKKLKKKQNRIETDEIFIDIFSVKPKFITNESSEVVETNKILLQKYSDNNIDGEFKDYYIACNDSSSIKMLNDVTKCYSILNAIEDGNDFVLFELIKILNKYVSGKKINFIFPDIYNEFQLSMLYKNLKIKYTNVKRIPNSIAVVSYYYFTEDFKNNFEIGDAVIVANLIKNTLSLTILRSSYDEIVKNKINITKGVIWERRQTKSISIKNDIDKQIISKLKNIGCDESEELYNVFSLEGILSEVDKLNLVFDKKSFLINKKVMGILKSFKIDISDKINDYLIQNRNILKKSKIKILLTSDNLLCNIENTEYITKENVLNGSKRLLEFEKKLDKSIWFDYLPLLAIKFMYGKFDLINNLSNNKIEPIFGKKQEINIESSFILPKEKEDYHFTLVQNDINSLIPYEAVVKSISFPLKKDIECKLKLYYEYGSENPYILEFRPIDTNESSFKMAKVLWKRKKEYNKDGLKYPEFPKKLSANELENKLNPKTGKYINIFEKLKEYYELILLNSKGPYKLKINSEKYQYIILGNTVCNIWAIDKERFKEGMDIYFYLKENFYLKEKKKRYVYEGYLEWFKNKKNQYQASPENYFENTNKRIIFYENNFLEGHFNVNIKNISFEILKKDGKDYLTAINIMNNEKKYEMKYYNAENITDDKEKIEPLDDYISPFYLVMNRIMFSYNRSILSEDTPEELKKLFKLSICELIELFYKYKEKNKKQKLLVILSLSAKDSMVIENTGDKYFRLIDEIIINNREIIPDEIGYALGDLTNQMQKELFNKIIKNFEYDKIIDILSKAIWHDEKFIYNIEPEFLIDKCMVRAIKLLLKTEAKRNKKYEISKKLEFILALFRLRSLNNEKINRKLSLNNKIMVQLYYFLEKLADKKIDLKSYLKLNITSKGKYNEMPDLLYALFIFLTGEENENEIKILGIDFYGDDKKENVENVEENE